MLWFCLSYTPGLSIERVYILVGISVAFLLCLLLLVVLLVHRLCQKKHGRSQGGVE